MGPVAWLVILATVFAQVSPEYTGKLRHAAAPTFFSFYNINFIIDK